MTTTIEFQASTVKAGFDRRYVVGILVATALELIAGFVEVLGEGDTQAAGLLQLRGYRDAT